MIPLYSAGTAVPTCWQVCQQHQSFGSLVEGQARQQQHSLVEAQLSSPAAQYLPVPQHRSRTAAKGNSLEGGQQPQALGHHHQQEASEHHGQAVAGTSN